LEKPGNQKTITIKINGNERSHDKGRKPEKPEIEETRYRNIEPISVKEAAAGQEAQDEDEFDWILPELEDTEEWIEYKIPNKKKVSKGKSYQPFSNGKKTSNKKSMLPSVFLTVFLAVVIGSSFGILLLKMVISDKILEVDKSPAVEEPNSEQAAGADVTSLELPAITGYIIQGGVFSNVEAATSESATITNLGIPTKIIKMDEKAYFFVGIADNLPNAKSIGEKLKGIGIETYAKESSFGGGTIQKLNDSEKKLLEQAPDFYQTLANISATASLSSAIPADAVASLTTQFETWNGIKGIENKALQELKTELEQAVVAINSYSDEKDAKLLTKIQQHLLNFLAIYHAL